MGGENELTTPKKAPAPTVASASPTGGIRIHDSNGEKHFHDDNNKTKAAVPISLWFQIATDLITLQRKHWEFLDPANESLLTIEMVETATGVYELIPTLKKIGIAPTLRSLSAHLKR